MAISCFVGLGNPGEDYCKTRHNVGFMVLDALAQKYDVKWRKPWWKPYLIADLPLENTVLGCKPMTFMNNSGRAVYSVLKKWNLKPEDILVIYDDVNLPLGKIRYRAKGSAGGHNGMKSIISYLETDDFPRLRIGIGQDPNNRIDHVLGDFDSEELETLQSTMTFLMESLPKFGSDTEEDLMQFLNSWTKPTL